MNLCGETKMSESKKKLEALRKRFVGKDVKTVWSKGPIYYTKVGWKKGIQGLVVDFDECGPRVRWVDEDEVEHFFWPAKPSPKYGEGETWTAVA